MEEDQNLVPIVVVDDKEEDGLMVKMQLELLGHPARAYTRSRETMAHAHMITEVTVFIIDRHLAGDPDGTSLDLIYRLRKATQGRGLIVVLTGDYSEDTEKEVMEAGAIRVFYKASPDPRFFHRMSYILEALAQQRREQLDQAKYDKLTGLPNLETFEYEVKRYLRRARDDARWMHAHVNARAHVDLTQAYVASMLLIDGAQFKRINDELGHDEGDEAIKIIAKALERRARDSDYICRDHGDEFRWFLPDTTEEDAVRAGERLREDFLHLPLFANKFPLGVYFGVATIQVFNVKNVNESFKWLILNSDTGPNGLIARRRAIRGDVVREE
jgi:diguanylate cyclase (GGDEF)-like protein